MKILIFHAPAGHGHRQVAEVIAETFRKRGFSSDEVKVTDALESTPFFFKKSYPAVYFNAVKYLPKIWGWVYETLDRPGIYRFLRPLRRFFNRLTGARLLGEVIAQGPDVIICAHFFSAELFATAKKKGELNALLVTVITDFYPHSFWVNDGTDVYWVMSEEGKRALKERGVDEKQIHPGGIPVAYAFKPSGRKEELLRRWNFSKERMTLLFTSGSFGLGSQGLLLKALEPFKDKIQCFVVCGMNEKLNTLLRARAFEFPVQVFGFVHFMADLMEASDLILTKCGGSTTTEALAKGVPIVVMDPIPGQETRNAHLLKARNAAFFIEKPDQIFLILKVIFEHPEILAAKHSEIQQLAKPNAADDLVTFILELLKKAAHEI